MPRALLPNRHAQIELLQILQADDGMKLAHLSVQARQDCVVIRFDAVVTHAPEASAEPGIAARDHPALHAYQHLGHREGKYLRVAETAHPAAVNARAERVGGVVDDRDPAAATPRGSLHDRGDTIDLAGKAIRVNPDHRGDIRMPLEQALEIVRRKRHVLADLGEYRDSARIADR